MRAVHDDIVHNFQHLWNVTEVNHQIMVAHHVATLCQPYLCGTSLAGFLYRIAHILSTQELTFLDVHCASSLGCCNEQISLPTQEGGYL